MSAAFIAVAVGAVALAVDVGSLYTERRALQGVADLAAMAGANDIERAEAAVAATLAANGIGASFTVERGQYAPDAAISHTQRFKAGMTPYNAVRINMSTTGNLYFGRLFTSQPISIAAAATAANASLATFSVGSRLLALDGGIANQLLGRLLGTTISLSVMDYEALVGADVELLSFMDALAGKLDITAGTYNDVLNASTTVGKIVDAAATVASQSGNTQALIALNTLLGQTRSLATTLHLSSLIDLGPLAMLQIGQATSGIDAKFSAMELISAAAALANGEHFVAFNLASGIPGVLALRVELAIGEPPQHSAWLALGASGSIVRTAQTRLRVLAEVGGKGLLSGISVRLPLFLDVAYGQGRLASVSCATSETATATIATRSGISDLWIGEVTNADFRNFMIDPIVSRSSIVDATLIKAKGRANLNIGSLSETMLTFNSADVANGTVKQTSTQNPLESAVSSLLNNLQLEVQILGLGLILPSAVTDAVGATLRPIAAPLDTVVISLLTALGVSVGQADVRVHGIRCGAGMLAG